MDGVEHLPWSVDGFDAATGLSSWTQITCWCTRRRNTNESRGLGGGGVVAVLLTKSARTMIVKKNSYGQLSTNKGLWETDTLMVRAGLRQELVFKFPFFSFPKTSGRTSGNSPRRSQNDKQLAGVRIWLTKACLYLACGSFLNL